jgi:hypothetical protein
MNGASLASLGVNVLLVAPDGLAEKNVDALRPDFSQPLKVWRPGSRLVLPPDGHTGTLILQDVGAMARGDQRWLCDWLEVTADRTRVISTTPQPLLPLVEADRFFDTLYFRLNVLCFQVIECES